MAGAEWTGTESHGGFWWGKERTGKAGLERNVEEWRVTVWRGVAGEEWRGRAMRVLEWRGKAWNGKDYHYERGMNRGL